MAGPFPPALCPFTPCRSLSTCDSLGPVQSLSREVSWFRGFRMLGLECEGLASSGVLRASCPLHLPFLKAQAWVSSCQELGLLLAVSSCLPHASGNPSRAVLHCPCSCPVSLLFLRPGGHPLWSTKWGRGGSLASHLTLSPGPPPEEAATVSPWLLAGPLVKH